jgi:hypothetical protein
MPPEKHRCSGIPSKPIPPYPKKENKIPHVSKWREIKKYVTLKNFTFLSIVLIFIGILPLIYPIYQNRDLLELIFNIGCLSFAISYLIYAYYNWVKNNKILAVFMLTIPLFVYYFFTINIQESTNILLDLFIIFGVCALLSIILLFISQKIKRGIQKILSPHKSSYEYFYPKISYSILGIVFISFLVINTISGTMFSDNYNVVTQEITAPTKPQYISNSPVSYGSQYPTVTITTIPPTAAPKKNLETGLTSRTFGYVLLGEHSTINSNLYSGVYNEISSEGTPATCVRYNYDSSPCTTEEIHQSYLKYLDESNQKKYLNNLVSSIRSKTSIKDDQARIAISLVQNIPYDYSRLYSFSTDMRYPYEVLYDNTGICAEKSLLLSYLLRELGYGVVLFEFKSENHMAVGIKSPVQYSYINSGYAFIESTSPTILTDSQSDYIGAGKLTSTPQIYQISDGNSMTSISEEYDDARTFHQVYNQINQMTNMYGSVLDQYQYARWQVLDNQWKALIRKYGIQVTYS